MPEKAWRQTLFRQSQGKSALPGWNFPPALWRSALSLLPGRKSVVSSGKKRLWGAVRNSVTCALMRNGKKNDSDSNPKQQLPQSCHEARNLGSTVKAPWLRRRKRRRQPPCSGIVFPQISDFMNIFVRIKKEVQHLLHSLFYQLLLFIIRPNPAMARMPTSANNGRLLLSPVWGRLTTADA